MSPIEREPSQDLSRRKKRMTIPDQPSERGYNKLNREWARISIVKEDKFSGAPARKEMVHGRDGREKRK